MPPPICPAPTTRTCSKVTGGDSSTTRGVFSGLPSYDARMASVRVRDDERPGRPADEVLVLTDLPERVSVRELIRTRVRGEVVRANADRTRPRRLLVAPVEAEEPAK